MNRCGDFFDTPFALVTCQLEKGHQGRHFHEDPYFVILWQNRDQDFVKTVGMLLQRAVDDGLVQPEDHVQDITARA